MNKEKYIETINYVNSIPLFTHFVKSAINISIVLIVLSFFITITYSGVMFMLYFGIGFQLFLSISKLTAPYYCRAALGQTLIGLIIAVAHIVQ